MQKKNLNNLDFFLDNKEMRLDSFINYFQFGNNGYYLKNKPIGKKNDFITSPEISQMFGEIIGLYLYYIWKTKINSKFNLIELGPGNGTLFKDIAASTSKLPDFLEFAEIVFIEINKKLIKNQKNNIKKDLVYSIEWRSSIDYKSNKPSIIYSNEFFDCFSVRQFYLKKFWFEKYVIFNEEKNCLIFKDKKVLNKKLLLLLDLYKKQKVFEQSTDRNKYFEKICKHIKKTGGLFFTIDYGYTKKITNFTLQAIQNHKYSHILENLGEKDVSSHVNFRDLVEIANKHKLKIEEFCSQREFLTKYGILERKKILSDASNVNLDKEVKRLIGKNEMGELFKVLIVSNL